jgi:hypothetical protein
MRSARLAHSLLRCLIATFFFEVFFPHFLSLSLSFLDPKTQFTFLSWNESSGFTSAMKQLLKLFISSLKPIAFTARSVQPNQFQ